MRVSPEEPILIGGKLVPSLQTVNLFSREVSVFPKFSLRSVLSIPKTNETDLKHKSKNGGEVFIPMLSYHLE